MIQDTTTQPITLTKIAKYLSVSDYPKLAKGSMVTGKPRPGLEITYDDGKQKFAVCCDASQSQKENRDKCIDIILTYVNSFNKNGLLPNQQRANNIKN